MDIPFIALKSDTENRTAATRSERDDRSAVRKVYELRAADATMDEDTGTIKGNASVMGVMDRSWTNDVIYHGFFKKALPGFRKNGFVPVGHNWRGLPVAMPTVAKEDGSNLYTEAVFHSTKDAQDARGYARAQDEDFYRRQRELLGRVVQESDVVITAAVIPGKKSPILITEDMVKNMAPGSVLFDLASERGGNCELTQPGKTIVAHGVTIIGAINVASGVPASASQMFARNITNFLLHLIKDQKLNLNLQDEIVRETLVTQGGEIVNARVRDFFKLPALAVSQ